MSSGLKLLICFAAIHFLGGVSAHAGEDYDSQLLLREALMESNGDYNKHKKKFIQDEYERADNWDERNEGAIAIGRSTVEPIAQIDASKKAKGREISSK